MRIACPACHAEYEVPGGIAAGRKVRCAKCGEDWTPITPEPADPEPPPAAEPSDEEAERTELEGIGDPPADAHAADEAGQPEQPAEPAAEAEIADGVSAAELRDDAAGEPAPRRRALAAAWACSGALLIGLAVAFVLLRAPIMAAWPPSARLYMALGFQSGAPEP